MNIFKKWWFYTVIVVFALLVWGVVSIVSFAISTVKEPRFTVSADGISIGGPYGTTIKMSEISRAYLKTNFPANAEKYGMVWDSAYNGENMMHGRYYVGNSSAYMLYIFRAEAPYLYIDTPSRYFIISLDETGETQALFDEIKGYLKK